MDAHLFGFVENIDGTVFVVTLAGGATDATQGIAPAVGVAIAVLIRGR